MVDPDDGAPLESRPPLLEDLLTICRALNEHGARYVVVRVADEVVVDLMKSACGVEYAEAAGSVERAILAGRSEPGA